MQKLIDTHCHLDYFENNEILDIVERSKNNGVIHLQTISTELSGMEKIANICHMYDCISCSIGVHPCNVQTVPSLEEMNSLYTQFSDCITSIGETGLDFSRPEYIDIKNKQIESLLIHAELSKNISKPLVIHVRDADNEFLDIAKNVLYSEQITGVMHCFTGTKSFMYKMLDYGFYISMSGIVTFKNAQDLQDCAKQIPLSRLLIETDSPYLAPTPYRGKRNEPSFVLHVAEFLAELHETSLSSISEITTQNALDLFKFKIA